MRLKKAVLAAVSVLILCAMLIGGAVISGAANVSFEQIVNASCDIIRRNEGAYGSVNRDDNGALSVGWLQWHANRALNLLKDIVSDNPSQANSILGAALYNEIVSSSSWAARTLTSAEASAISNLLVTSQGKSRQDSLGYSDVSSYVNHGLSMGITSPSALVYLADIENQCGGGGASRVASSAAGTVGGYDTITLKTIHTAALNDRIAGKYSSRRNTVYNSCILLGWDDGDLYGTYEVWCATTTLNVRSAPGSSNSLVTQVSGGSNLVITAKRVSGDSVWGKCYMGWVSLSYCNYVKGSISMPVCFYTEGGSFTGKLRASAKVDGVNTLRYANTLVVYTTGKAQTNEYGTEVAIGSDHRAAAKPAYGQSQTAVPNGGLVVSGNGTMSDWLWSNISSGDYVAFDEATMTLNVYTTYQAYASDNRFISYGKAVGELYTPTKDGSIFEGWYTQANGGTKVSSSYVSSSRAGVILYAHWREAQNSSIAYVTDGGTLSGTLQTAIAGVNVWRAADTIVIYNRENGTSTGTNAYGVEAAVDKTGRIVSFVNAGNTEIPEGGFVISAHGSAISWLNDHISTTRYASYDSSGKTLTVYSSDSVYDSINKTIKEGTAIGDLPEASREYYDFLGWYTASGAKAGPETKMVAGGMILYARWQIHPGTVYFETDGGHFSGPVSKTVTKGSPWGELPVPVKAGYRFIGWKTEAGKQVASTDTVDFFGDVTLFALWEKLTVTYSFDTNGGTFSVTDVRTAVSGYNIARTADSLVVYDNGGTTTGTNDFGREAAVGPDGVVIAVYPNGSGDSPVPEGGFVLSGHGIMDQWLLDNVHVGSVAALSGDVCRVYDSLGDYRAAANSFAVDSGVRTGELPVPKKTGYNFVGWYDGDTLVNENTVRVTDFAVSTVLKARWEVIKVRITFDPQGGSLEKNIKAAANADAVNAHRAANTIVVYDSGMGATTNTNPYGTEAVVSADGRVSWVGYGKGSASIPTGGFVVSGNGTGSDWVYAHIAVGNIVLFDKSSMALTVYTENEYLKITEKTVAYGSALGYLPIPTTDIEGADFLGWFENAEGGEALSETTLSYYLTDTTLYAQWLLPPEKYTLSFDAEGGEGAPEGIIYTSGDSVTIPESNITKHYSVFLGWDDGSGSLIQPGDSYLPQDGGVILHAVWRLEHAFDGNCTVTGVVPGDNGEYIYTYTCSVCNDSFELGVAGDKVLISPEMKVSVDNKAQIATADVILDSEAIISRAEIAFDLFSTAAISEVENTGEGYSLSYTETADGMVVRLEAENGSFDAADVSFRIVLGLSVETQNVPLKVLSPEAITSDGLPCIFTDVSVSLTVTGLSLRGDVNGDGVVSVSDLNALLRHIVGRGYYKNPDVNGDGRVTVSDIYVLKRILVGLH